MASIEFYTIYRWMREELHLEDTELSCYAVIYGLSQGDNWYNAGVKNIMDILGKSKPTVISALSDLTEKGLIVKVPVVVNNAKRNYYKATKFVDEATLNDLTNPRLNDLTNPRLNDLSTHISKYNNKENKKENVKKKVPNGTQPTEEESQFISKMKDRFPRIMKMDKPLTLEQANKLKEKYDRDLLAKVMVDLENWKPLLKKSVSAYMTINKWCQMELERL